MLCKLDFGLFREKARASGISFSEADEISANWMISVKRILFAWSHVYVYSGARASKHASGRLATVVEERA